MAIADIFIDKRPKVGLLTMDASLNETHVESADWTEHPVELGADISDHRTVRRAEVTIDGAVSRIIDPFRVRSLFDGSPTRHLQAWQMLRSMLHSGMLVTVVTSLRTYENMAIHSLSAPRNLEASEVLRFSVVLREVQFANTAAAGDNPVPTFADLVSKDDTGTQSTREAARVKSAKALGLLRVAA
ncbi:MAG: hypothetical protein GY926_19335 [bacterium]|nr:hypothetical protein [bacterium]